jgi:hypothetical protein
MQLSQDIIDKIITIDINKIVSLLEYIKNQKTLSNGVITRSRKRKHYDEFTFMCNQEDKQDKKDKKDKKDKEDDIIRYYKQSSWLKYFILEDDNINSINKKIRTCMQYYSLLNSGARTNLDTFETYLVKYEFNTSQYATMLSRIAKYYDYNSINNLPEFIKFFLIMNNNYNINYPTILKEITEGFPNEKNQWQNTLISYPYYASKYKFIPLVESYCGMGYNFIIGWDCNISRMIGLYENGSSIYDYEFNKVSAMKYFNMTSEKRKMQLSIKHKIEDYLKILNINCIDTRMEYTLNLSIN